MTVQAVKQWLQKKDEADAVTDKDAEEFYQYLISQNVSSVIGGDQELIEEKYYDWIDQRLNM